MSEPSHFMSAFFMLVCPLAKQPRVFAKTLEAHSLGSGR